jgi:ribonuclease P protein component
MNLSFGKEYKLCSRKTMDVLFKEGKRLHKFPFRITYQLQQTASVTSSFKVVVSVPKRQFKKAHDRNHIKRLIRESLRKNKLNLETFLIAEKLFVDFVLVYSTNEIISQSEIDKQMDKTIKLLIDNIKDETIST